jgi:uncharacterized membrane-anchored protein YjiN (DUF445 family)
MNNNYKAQQLKNYKLLATGLFLLMLAIYIFTHWLMKVYPANWQGYIKAFAEAAMVGALADWFAVTALFHQPLGLPIPHTNLIETSKKRIGDNLGNFVVTNFLNATNIRPYIKKITVAAYAAQWLSKESNKKILIAEITRLLNDIIRKADDESIIQFIIHKGKGLASDAKLHNMVADALDYFLNKKEHEKLITVLAERIKKYIIENEEMVREKVRKESLFFIPRFIDDKLAQKIGNGLVNYFDEIEHDTTHKVRVEITEQLYIFSESLRNDSKWEQEFQQLKTNILTDEKLKEYAKDLWFSLKATLQQELTYADSALVKYFAKNLDELAYNLQTDNSLQQKIDRWVHYNAYKYILKNAGKVSSLISDTIGNWQGKELSRKLELEVGKDLQFIRINGTLVGGLMGLIIHILTVYFS